MTEDTGAAGRGPDILQTSDASLLELIDNLLDKGVLIDGQMVLGLADVDLIYLRLSVLISAADRILGPGLDGGGEDGPR